MYQAKKTANYVFGFRGKNEAFLTTPVGLDAADLHLFPEGPMEMLAYLGERGFSKLPEAINELFPLVELVI